MDLALTTGWRFPTLFISLSVKRQIEVDGPLKDQTLSLGVEFLPSIWGPSRTLKGQVGPCVISMLSFRVYSFDLLNVNVLALLCDFW